MYMVVLHYVRPLLRDPTQDLVVKWIQKAVAILRVSLVSCQMSITDPVLTKIVVPKQEVTTPCKTEESEDVDIEKDVDVEEFSDAENVSASSPSALSCEDEVEADEDEEEEEDAKSKSSSGGNGNGKSGNGKSNGRSGNRKKSRSEPVNHLIKPRCNCDELTTVDCQLETKELWDKFHELGTEMIITKTGR